MLRDENLDPATIRRLMDQYTAENQWNYKKSKKAERLEQLHSGSKATAKQKGGISNDAPKPRTYEICKWRGSDEAGECSVCCGNA